MNFKSPYGGHLTWGLGLGFLVATVSVYYFGAIGLAHGLITFLANQFPDLDTRSKPRQYAFKFGLVLIPALAIGELYFKVQGLWMIAAAYIAVYLAARAGKHRGWTHSYLLPIALFACAWHFIDYRYYLASIAIGIIGHLIQDKVKA